MHLSNAWSMFMALNDTNRKQAYDQKRFSIFSRTALLEQFLA